MFDAMYKTASFKNFKPERFLSQGSIEINGKEVPYKTVCEDNVFYNNAGKPIASIFSYTYIRTDVKDQKDRPVIFGFNGNNQVNGKHKKGDAPCSDIFSNKSIRLPNAVPMNRHLIG